MNNSGRELLDVRRRLPGHRARAAAPVVSRADHAAGKHVVSGVPALARHHGDVPAHTQTVAKALGFTLLSNFFFCTAIAALAILHLRALVTLSRVHLRTIALTQELAILQEKLERL